MRQRPWVVCRFVSGRSELTENDFHFRLDRLVLAGLCMNQPEATVETRCECGRLLARLTDAGIELKCSRCRRVVVIAWSAVKDDRVIARQRR
jgi:hypothetical protein